MEMQTIDQTAATETRAAFTVERDTIRAAVDMLSGKIVERRNTIPQLAGISIEALPDNRLLLSATDLDIFARIDVAAQVESPGRFVLDAKALADMLKGLNAKREHLSPTVALAAVNAERAKAARWEEAWNISQKDLRDATEAMERSDQNGRQAAEFKRKHRRALSHAMRYRASAWELSHAAVALSDEYVATNAKLAAAKMTPTYMGEDHRERPDVLAIAFDHTIAERERGDALSTKLETARGSIGAMESRIDQMADALMEMTGRALRAETALAATTARINGWPPAVTKVTFGRAA